MTRSRALSRTRDALGSAARDARAGWSGTSTLWVVAAGAALLAPAVLPLSGRMPDLASFVYLALAAVGLSYAVGLAGIPSLGQGAFMGIAAFTEATLRAKSGWPLLPSILLSVLAASAAGVLTGLGTGRLRGAFVAVSTWILSWIVLLALTSFPELSGGAQGLVLPEASVLGVELTPTVHYELGVVLVSLAVLAYAVLRHRGPGLALAAAREQPAAALSLGVPVARLRLGAFTASAAVAGLAGALSVELVQVADPSAYGPLLSFTLFVAVIVGGARSPLGALAGMLVIAAFSNAAEEIGALRGLAPGRLEMMLTGYGLLLVLGLGGAGIVPAATARWRRFRGPPRRSAARDEVATIGMVDDPRALTTRGLTKRFGSLVALDDLELSVEPGEIHALIGPNGSGKTTALRLLVGFLPADSGSVALGGTTLDGLPIRERVLQGVVATQQTTAIFEDLTVLETTLIGAGLRRRHGGALRALLATPKARAEQAAARRKALGALELVGLADDRDRPAVELPVHGQRLLMLASALATEPRTLLLDEPAAGAAPAELARLAALLKQLRQDGLGLLVVEHNLRFVRSVADRVTVLDAGRKIAAGTLAEIAADETVRTAYLGRRHS